MFSVKAVLYFFTLISSLLDSAVKTHQDKAEKMLVSAEDLMKAAAVHKDEVSRGLNAQAKLKEILGV